MLVLVLVLRALGGREAGAYAGHFFVEEHAVGIVVVSLKIVLALT